MYRRARQGSSSVELSAPRISKHSASFGLAASAALPQPPSGGSLCSCVAPGSALPLEWVVQLAKFLVTDSLGQELRNSYW